MDNYQYVRVKNVFFTKHHQGIWSCHELVQWINKELNCHVHSVEHLCTGAAYCGLMDKLFPGIINMLKVKFCANQEYEYLANFRLVQTAFDQVRVITQIPMLGLAKGRLSDNLEFACWFRRFVEANNKKAICPHYDPLAARGSQYIGVGPSRLPTCSEVQAMRRHRQSVSDFINRRDKVSGKEKHVGCRMARVTSSALANNQIQSGS